MVSAVCKLQFDGLTAFRAGVDRLCREQRVAFRCGGFFYRNVGIQRQIVENHLAGRGRNAGQRCFLSGVGQLKGTACQSRTGFIGFQDTHANRTLCDLLIDENKLCGGLLDRRFDQNDRLNTAGVGRCNINIIAVYIHRRGNSSLQLGVCRVHLFGGRFRDTQQKGFAVSHIVAVFVQRFVIPHITQRQCAVCAFCTRFAHQKCAGRQFVSFERDFIAAYKCCGSRRHRQNQTGLSVDLLFCKHTGFDDTAGQIDRAGLYICCAVCAAARCIIDRAAGPRRMIFPVRAPHIVECVAVFQHLDCGVQCQRLGGGRCTQRLAGRAVAERGRTGIGNTKIAVRCNLCIAQRNPDSRL